MLTKMHVAAKRCGFFNLYLSARNRGSTSPMSRAAALVLS
jgi:hypothetical protein